MTDKIDFTGRVAIVTGAGGGLGRDYALQLAARGAKVVVNDLGGTRDGRGGDDAAANRVVEEIRARGGEAVPSYDNVATVSGGRSIVDTALEAYGRIDVLINNAGILRDKTFVKIEESDWDAVMAVHLRGAYCVTRPAFEVMKKNRYGRIVMTSSMAGTLGNFGQANYSAAKLGVFGLANALKLEGRRDNVLVNVVVPGAATRMTEELLPPEVLARMGVEWVTPAVLCLCSEACTDTGLCINAFAGYYGRTALMTGPGELFSEVPDPERLLASWEKIKSLETAKTFEDANALFADLLGRAILRT